MAVPQTLRVAALSAALALAAGAAPLTGQEPAEAGDPLHRVTRTPDDLVHLRSVRPVPPAPGGTVIVRWSVWNPGAVPVELAEDPCAVEYGGALRIDGVERRCSPGARTLAPGDSAWVEFRGRVASPAGAHDVGSLLPGVAVPVTPGDVLAPAPGADPLRPPPRVPVVLELGDPRLDRDRVRALIQEAAGHGLVLLVTPEAARAQVETASWLRLALEPGEGGGIDANACWHRAGDGDAECAALRTRIPAAPTEELLASSGPLRRLAATLLSLRNLAP
jgi:hypothetical protein